MNLPNDAKMLISLFEQNGHTAYAVGGCVRDALMGVAEKDIDITTSATPGQTEQRPLPPPESGGRRRCGTHRECPAPSGYPYSSAKLEDHCRFP